MKGNTTSMIALIVAMLVLIVVAANSYNNYLRSQYEKEYGVLEKHRVVANTNLVPATIQQPNAGVLTSTLDPGTAPLSQSIPSANSPNSVNPPTINQAPSANSPATTPGYRTGVGAVPIPLDTSSAEVDPELARLQARLKALEEESALYQQKFNQMKSGGSAPVAKPVQSGTLREVLNQADRGASSSLPPKQATTSSVQSSANAEFEKQIRNAPAAGKVIAFNPDWGFVQINAGKNRNISEGTRFAVRRGVSIVGYVKVTQVSDKMSIAELTSRNEFSETARKPKPGDDVISWPLF